MNMQIPVAQNPYEARDVAQKLLAMFGGNYFARWVAEGVTDLFLLNSGLGFDIHWRVNHETNQVVVWTSQSVKVTIVE